MAASPRPRKPRGPRKPLPSGERRQVYRDYALEQDRNAIKQSLLDTLTGGGGPKGLGATTPFAGPPPRAPKIPLEPTPGNPYAGAGKAVGRFAAQSKARTARYNKADRAAYGRGDREIDQAVGGLAEQQVAQGGELAAQASSLQAQLSQRYAQAELDRQGQLAKNRYEQRVAQYKADAELASGQQLSLSLAERLQAVGIDPTPFLNNPMAAAITLGRITFARNQELGGFTAANFAQAARAGLPDPRTFPDVASFQTALGQAQGGAGGQDVQAFLQWAAQLFQQTGGGGVFGG